MHLKNEENLILELRGESIFFLLSKAKPKCFGVGLAHWDWGKKEKKKQKNCGAVDTLEVRAAIHRDFATLERWNSANLLRFNKVKCKALHMGCGSPNTPTDWVGKWLRAALQRKTWM